MQEQPVDVVITWVNGNDPKHRAKLKKHLSKLGIDRPEGAAPTRFNQCGELEFCIRSILNYAPWVRNIYVITDNQIPALQEEFLKRIKLVDHAEIFEDFEENLPTFNSVAIETMLWRIKELSENFIYFNDDCLLIRPVTYEDFFRDNKIVLRGEWKRISDNKFLNRLKKSFNIKRKLISSHQQLQENSAKLSGFTKHFFDLPHVPFPLKKSGFENFFSSNPDLILKNVSFKFRNRSQFWPISLFYHLEIQQKNVIFDKTLKGITINPGFHSADKIKTRLTNARKNKKIHFLCIQSLDAANDSIKGYILNYLVS